MGVSQGGRRELGGVLNSLLQSLPRSDKRSQASEQIENLIRDMSKVQVNSL
jgi:hypothetical protein